jgi:hypothetical protein
LILIIPICAFALQMRLKTIPESAMETEDQEGEIPVSFEEYQLQALVNKRAAVGMAQVSEVYCHFRFSRLSTVVC